MTPSERKEYPIIQVYKDIEAVPIVDEVTASLSYIGHASLGTKTDAAGWKILRITKTGTVTLTEYADGDMKYDNIWDNRATLNYSR